MNYCLSKRCYSVVESPGICAKCTKRACIDALNASGDIYPAKHALVAYVKWPLDHTRSYDRIVWEAYHAIGEYLDDGPENCLKGIYSDKETLLKCRSLIIESVFILNRPRDIKAIIRAIDDSLLMAHKIIVCEICAKTLDGQKELILRRCEGCRDYDTSKFLNVVALVTSAIARGTGFIRPIAQLVADYIIVN